MSESDASVALAAVLAAEGIELTDVRLTQLDRYRLALWRWNEQLNLTRHTTIAKFVQRDVVDSLALAAQLPRDRRVLDLGSGGGVPGIILAICRPDLRMALCESTQKKAKVLQSLVAELELPTEVFHCRAEELLGLRTFDVVVARAVAPLAKLLQWLSGCWDSFDELLLVKGQAWVDERAEARHRGLLRGLQLRKLAQFGPAGDPAPGSVILGVRRRRGDDHEAAEAADS